MSSSEARQQIFDLEGRLRQAMLTSNLSALDELLHDGLVFTAPDGGVYTKTDDIELYRSGRSRMSEVDVEELRIDIHATTAVVIVKARLQGVFKGQAFCGTFRYLRVWCRQPAGWRVVAGSVHAVS